MTLKYPETRVEHATDALAGVQFQDPFHWLEESSAEVRQWQLEQAELAHACVRQWPHFDQLRRLVVQLSVELYGTVPRYAAGRWFRTRVVEGGSHAQAIVSDTPTGSGRVLFDGTRQGTEVIAHLSWIAPSPDGRTLAIGVGSEGTETKTIQLVDVATGEKIADCPSQPVLDSVCEWLPDSSGFFFVALNGAAAAFEQRAYLYRRTPQPSTIPLDIAWTTAKDWRWIAVSREGRYALAFERIMNPVPVAIAELKDDRLQWKPFIAGIDGTVAGHVVGDEYVAVTDVAAPRGRVVAISLKHGEPNDTDAWRELIPESDAVLRTITPVGRLLYLSEFVATYARVRIVDLDGHVLGTVPLPGSGEIGAELWNPWLSTWAKGHPEKFLFVFSSLVSSPGLYCHVPGDEKVETLEAPKIRIENAVVEDRWALSADGTRVPYHLVRRADVNTDRPQPTLIYAYGGFNGSLVPGFPGPMAAIVAAGGVFVHAHLRGGGELGLRWWQEGRMGRKQNGYDDLYAVAEDLIASQRSTPALLAVTGSSNGGLMTGVAITQRPDLWAVAIPQMPLLDLIGFCRESYGRMCVAMEFADVEDPAEVLRLATFSPYHLVQEGVSYPAVYLNAGDTDARCPAWHARKFAARLQRATSSDAPVLLHVWDDVGHGGATDPDVTMNQQTEWLAFTMRQLGLGDWL
jgi:prolyl oligopeptidase